MLSEFDIIRRCFEQPGLAAEPGTNIRLGIGDDCALLTVPAGKDLAVSMDTLVSGVHFPASAPPDLVAYRALAVNLSDLAAMGATPAGFTLALTVPEADNDWLDAFSAGLKACASEYECPLIGGDTTRGPLTITIQVHGYVDAGRAITRSGAVSGDAIYVTGTLGNSALAIQQLLQNTNMDDATRQNCENAFYRPRPRLGLGLAAAGIVSAGMDISDGLLGDLGHICQQSHAGADVLLADIPLGAALKENLAGEKALALAVTGGDDYELLLTVSAARENELQMLASKQDLPLHRIGEMTATDTVRCLDAGNREVTFTASGYRHF